MTNKLKEKTDENTRKASLPEIEILIGLLANV